MKKILVTAEQFGYGPIATCLNVVKELYKYPDVEMTFMGTGIALEQARMTNYFKTIIECKTYDEKELEPMKEEFLKYDVILSSENIPGARFALKIGHKNVYYMDNLMWMWDKLENGISDLKGYIISETFSCKENFERIGKSIKRTIFVGPLRKIEISENDTPKENKLIINIGGAEAFIIDSNIVISFYNKLINEIIDTNGLVLKFDKIIICGGSGVISNLKINNKSEKIRIETLANKDYLEELKSASHLIMAPGLGNFIETLWRDKNIMYIPPVNYSQLLQLEEYKKMNFGFEMVNWSTFPFYRAIPTLMNENAGVDEVIKNVREYLNYDDSNVINNAVAIFLSNDQSVYYKRRREFVNNLPKDASVKVAKLIYEETE